MSTFGIEIRNDDNNIIIDGENPQFLIRVPALQLLVHCRHWIRNIPGSGVGGNGQVLGSDFLFGGAIQRIRF